MSGVWLASYIVLWLVVLVLAFLLAGSLRPTSPQSSLNPATWSGSPSWTPSRGCSSSPLPAASRAGS
jgi:hypothetical protein